MSKLKFSESKSEEPGLAALAQGLRRLAADASVETLQQETVAVAVSLCGAERGYWAAAGETACIGDTTCFAVGDGMVVLEHAQAVDAALLDILATAASIALTNAALREQSRQASRRQDWRSNARCCTPSSTTSPSASTPRTAKAGSCSGITAWPAWPASRRRRN
jgi:hypothetical protein